MFVLWKFIMSWRTRCFERPSLFTKDWWLLPIMNIGKYSFSFLFEATTKSRIVSKADWYWGFATALCESPQM